MNDASSPLTCPCPICSKGRNERLLAEVLATLSEALGAVALSPTERSAQMNEESA